MEPKQVIRDLLSQGKTTDDIKKNLQELGVQNTDQLIEEAKAEKEKEEAKKQADPYLPPEKAKQRQTAKTEKTQQAKKTEAKQASKALKIKQQKTTPTKQTAKKTLEKQKPRKEAKLVEFKPPKERKKDDDFTEVQVPFFSNKEDEEKPTKSQEKKDNEKNIPTSQDAVEQQKEEKPTQDTQQQAKEEPKETVQPQQAANPEAQPAPQPQDAELASVPSRAIAKLIDVLILFAAGLALSLVPAVGSYLEITLMVLYPIFFIGWRGQTPGKMIAGIKVIKTNGSNATYATGLVREIGEFLSLILLTLGYWLVLFDKQRQGLHDKLAGTLVVKAK